MSELSVSELHAQIAKAKDELSKRGVGTRGDIFTCPGAIRVRDVTDEEGHVLSQEEYREECDFASDTLAAVCEKHGTHVA